MTNVFSAGDQVQEFDATAFPQVHKVNLCNLVSLCRQLQLR